MKKRRQTIISILSLFLAILMTVSAAPVTGGLQANAAASYSSDYRRWSQNKSAYAWMRSYGCRVVAEAKLIYETGINKSASFNPDVYYKWCLDKGYVNNGGFVYRDNPVRYAKSLGNYNLSYSGNTSSDNNNKAISNSKNGYYSICEKKGSSHYFIVNKDKTKSTGTIYIYDSWGDSTTNIPPAVYKMSDAGHTIKNIDTFVYKTASDVTVTFDKNGGDTVSQTSLTINANTAMGVNIPSAIREGYVFDGWYTKASGGEFYSTSKKITKSVKLYAHWVKSDPNVLKVGDIVRILSVKSVDDGTPRYFYVDSSEGHSVVTLQDELKTRHEMWRVTAVDKNGYYSFETLLGFNAMDVDTTNGRYQCRNKLQLWTPKNHNAQKFAIVDRFDGTIKYSIHNVHSGRALDCSGNKVDAGTVIQQYYYNGTTNQQFRFIDAKYDYQKICAHQFTSVVTKKATLTDNGLITMTCSECGFKKTKAISNIQSVKLSNIEFTYTGTEIEPAVTVKDSDGNVISPSNYSVIYSNNINIGKGLLEVVFKGNYSGSITRRFNIYPKKTSFTSVTAGKTSITWKWKKVDNVTGYQIRYWKKGDYAHVKYTKITNAATLQRTIKKLKRKTDYYYSIRTYKTVTVDGEKKAFFSDWSNTKHIKTK